MQHTIYTTRVVSHTIIMAKFMAKLMKDRREIDILEEKVADLQEESKAKEQEGRVALIEKWADLIWLNPNPSWIANHICCNINLLIILKAI